MGDESSTRLIPTQDEKDALKGTGATPPSRFNPFVSNDDSRLAGGGAVRYLDILPQSLIPTDDGMEQMPYVSGGGVITVFMDFDDGQNAQITRVMPDNYDGGTLRARFFGKSKSGSGSADMGFAARAVSAGDGYDESWGTGEKVTIAVEDDEESISGWAGPITPGGVPGGGKRMMFFIYHDGGAAIFELTGVQIEYGIT